MRIACVLAVIGCGGGDDGYDCPDKRYDNGSCETDVMCGAPDIDCFVTFDSPTKARFWYDADAEAVAIAGPSIPPTDPRYAPLQALVERGWEAYTAVYEVGDLAAKPPRLVLIDNAEVNAFVKSDLDRTRAGHAVMINTGLVDLGASEDQVLGVIAHEIEHIVGLHVNFAVNTRIRAYYKAGATTEPLGFEQTDDADVRARIEGWLKYQQFVGFWSDAELGTFPLTTTKPSVGGAIAARGLLGEYFGKLVLEQRDAINTIPCTDAVTAFFALHEQTRMLMDPVDNGFALSASMTTSFTDALATVRDQCFGGVAGDAFTHLARLSGLPDAALRANAPFEVKFEIESKPLFTGWVDAIEAGRRSMRSTEDGALSQFGVPWNRLRYFSTEEAADDASTRVMLALGLPGDGAAQLLVDTTPKLAPKCAPLVAASAAPYGEDLADHHHATCWRQMHQRQLGATLPAAKLPWRPPGPRAYQPFVYDVVDAPRTSH